MSNVREEDGLVLNWLSFDCKGQEGCTADDDSVSLDVGELSSKTVKVELSSADRARSFALIFTTTVDDKLYKSVAFLLVFADSVPEFAVAYVFILFLIAAIIFSLKSDLFFRKR